MSACFAFLVYLPANRTSCVRKSYRIRVNTVNCEEDLQVDVNKT